MQRLSVPVVDIRDVSQFRLNLASELPFVIRNMTDDWPANTKWTPEYLKETGKGCRVYPWQLRRPVDGSQWHDYSIWERQPDEDFTKLVDRLYGPAGKPWHVGLAAPEDFNLGGDIRRHPTIAERVYFCSIWFGTKDYSVTSHVDCEVSMLSQIQGRKRVFMVPRSQCRNLVPFPLFHEQNNFFQANLATDVEDAFPGVTIYQADLEPQQTLCIPQGWAHQVLYLETCISVNFFLAPSLWDWGAVRRGLRSRVPDRYHWAAQRLVRAIGLDASPEGVVPVGSNPGWFDRGK